MSKTEIHTCFTLSTTSFPCSQIIEQNESAVNRWVDTGIYQSVNTTQDCGPILAKFNPCSRLPIVQVQILEVKMTAIVDTGAVRSLISSTMAAHVWGEQYRNLLDSSCNCILKDVNSNIVSTQGSIKINIIIGSQSFSFDFIVYDSGSQEILLGFDLLRCYDIGIFPNLGLVYKKANILNILESSNGCFEMRAGENINIPAHGQVLAWVNIDPGEAPHNAACITNTPMLAHSELLQPDTDWQELMIFFQYVTVHENLRTEVLIVNHTDSILFFTKNQLVGHLEPIINVASKDQIDKNEFASIFLSFLDDVQKSLCSQSLPFPEDRICIEPQKDVHFKVEDINCHSSDPADTNWLNALHIQFKSIFSSDEFDPGEHDSSVHFSVRSNATILHQKYQQINPRILSRARSIIDTLLSRGLIEISDSPWSSRIIFVEKAPAEIQNKDDRSFVPGQKIKNERQARLRLVLDLRHVNQRLKSANTNWVVPSVWSILSSFHDAKYVSTIDINSGFWTFRLSDKARRLTAFQFEDFTYCLTRLPQGLKCSSALMQFKMAKLVVKYKLKGVSIYIDNIIVQAPDLTSYKERLSALFLACLTENIRIKQNKSHHFITKNFILFGFNLDLVHHTISPDMDKVQKLLDLDAPQTKKRVRAFIGGTAYFSNMVPKFQEIMAPLHKLAAPKTKFEWTGECAEAFHTIKKLLAKLPFLYLYNPRQVIYFVCDAAMGSYIAYCLYQTNGAGQKHPIKFNSHKMSESEKRLSQFEAEALALIFAISREPGIIGFGNAVLITDARSLTYIARFSKTTAKLSRWDIYLKSYDIQVEFSANTHGLIKMTDLLTRGNTQPTFKNKVTEKQIADFMQLNFAGLPRMSLRDTMFLIHKVLALLEVNKNTKQMTQNIKLVFPFVPDMHFQVSSGDTCGEGHYVSQHQILRVGSSTPFTFQEEQFDNFSKSVSFQSLDPPHWSEEEKVTKHTILESIMTFLPQISKKYLILLQDKTTWIAQVKLKVEKKKSHLDYFLFEGILLRKHQLQNGLWCNQIVLPEVLIKPLVKHFHEQSYFKHLGVVPMGRQLSVHFYIKNFAEEAKKVVANCRFCNLNKTYPLGKMEPGLRILVNQPRTLLYLDICTVQSSQKLDSFLTVVDGFSRFSIFIPVSRHATATDIVDLLFSHWFRHYSFPLMISTDGASNFVNKLVGEIACQISCKMVRIAPYNSKANLAERYNKYALFALKFFHQYYTITPSNFSMVLSLVSQMLNQQRGPNGFCPFYLHFGVNPRNNNFITKRSINTMKDEAEYSQQLCRAQNIIFHMNSQSKNVNKSVNQLQQFKKGDFVLLKKMSVGTPRNMHKFQPLYHKQIYRIIKRTRTNALLVPYTKKFIQNRLKQEGQVPKNMGILQRLSNLKPVKNVFKHLNLSLSQQMVLELNNIVRMTWPEIQEVKIVPNDAAREHKASQMVRDFHPSVRVYDDGSNNEEEEKKINNIKLQTIVGDSVSGMSDTVSTITRIIPVKQKGDKNLFSDWGSSSVAGLQDFEIKDEYIDDYQDRQSSSLSSLSDIVNNGMEETHSLPKPIESIRVTPASKEKPQTVTRTLIRLPSGNALSIQNVAKGVATIRDKSSPVSVRSNPRPRSLITDMKKSVTKK